MAADASAATVGPSVQSLAPRRRYWTTKPVSVSDQSLQVSLTSQGSGNSVGPCVSARKAPGAFGGPVPEVRTAHS